MHAIADVRSLHLSISLLAAALWLSLATDVAEAQSSCQGTACVKQVTVKPGGSVVLAPGINSIRGASDCSFLQPEIKTITAPQQGRIVPSVVSFVIPAKDPLGASTGDCAGKSTKGLRITYVASKNAKGSDEVVLQVTTPASPAGMTARYVIAIEDHR